MAQIKFYRGVSENSLPGHQDGAVYIIASDSSEPVPGGGSGVFYLGDMYVDMADNKRIHIKSKEGIYAKTDTEWANSPEWDSTSIQDKIYIRITSTHQPIIAIGDGSTLVKNLTYRSLDAVYTPASSVSAVGTTSAVGTATEYARADHVHNITTATVTSLLGSAAVKNVVTSVTSASEDLPTSKAVNAAINAAVTAAANQNAFSNIKVGTTTVAADSATDTFELAAGSNISLTTDITNDKITISATDTKYTAASNVSAVGTTSSVGTSTAYARADHVHNITSATIISALTYTPANANDLPSGSMVFKGVTTIAINDGSTTELTDIYTDSATPKAGDVVAYHSKEFVWGGSPAHWIEFGDFSDLQNALGNFAYANAATGEYTPSGTLTITLPTASKNVVSSVSTSSVNSITAVNASVSGELLTLTSVTASKITPTVVVTAVTTAAQTMVTGQPTTKTFTGTTATITVSPDGVPM